MTTYCFDTSGLVEPWNRLYPIDRFPSFWERLDELIGGGQVVSPEEVFRELQRKDDGLHGWIKSRKQIFVPLEGELLARGIEVTNRHKRLLEQKPGRSGADPWVVALGAVRQAVVVTQETLSSNPNKPRIPNVCKAEGVKHINVLELLRLEDWTF